MYKLYFYIYTSLAVRVWGSGRSSKSLSQVQSLFHILRASDSKIGIVS